MANFLKGTQNFLGQFKRPKSDFANGGIDTTFAKISRVLAIFLAQLAIFLAQL